MIRDLDGAGVDRSAQADILVIGAGTCGLAMAAELARKGQRVIVLESGGLVQEAEAYKQQQAVDSARQPDVPLVDPDRLGERVDHGGQRVAARQGRGGG